MEAGGERYGCPVCPRQWYSLMSVARHLAMKKDEPHTSWRVTHGLPQDYQTISEGVEITQKVMEILENHKTERG